MKNELSVVIAFKGDQDEIKRCFRSVRNESDAVVIFADAGSTDGSREMIHEIARMDCRSEYHKIEAINEPDVRNQILPLIQTSHVWFINATAPIPNNACESLMAKAIEYDADITAFTTKIGSRGKADFSKLRSKSNPYSLDAKRSWFANVSACMSPPSARIYKTEFLRSGPNLVFPIDNAFEAYLHNWYSTILAKRFVVLTDFFYRQGKASPLSTWKISGWFYHADILDAVRRVERFLTIKPERKVFMDIFKATSKQAVDSHLSMFYKYASRLNETSEGKSLFEHDR